MKKHQYAVMMAGGIGSRFWPLSKAGYPKQFIDILGTGKTLLQHSYERLRKTFAEGHIFIVTNEAYRQLTLDQLPELKEECLLLEGVRKNTAPCIAYAAHKILSLDSNACVAITPSDHIIINEEKFSIAINKALKVAEKKDILITLGIAPTRPDTGYGYIQFIEEKESDGLYKVKTFVEKPPIEMATTFFRSGDFLWNAGIFIANVRTLLNAYHHYLPEVNDIFKEGKRLYNTPAEKDFADKAFILCPSVSIDNAIMEKAKNVSVMPARFGWSDLGTWASLYEEYGKDYWGNAVSGKNVMIYDAQNCMVMVPDEKLVVLEGLEDFIVVDTKEALLICRKSQEQKIKEIVMDIKLKKGEKYL